MGWKICENFSPTSQVSIWVLEIERPFFIDLNLISNDRTTQDAKVIFGQLEGNKRGNRNRMLYPFEFTTSTTHIFDRETLLTLIQTLLAVVIVWMSQMEWRNFRYLSTKWKKGAIQKTLSGDHEMRMGGGEKKLRILKSHHDTWLFSHLSHDDGVLICVMLLLFCWCCETLPSFFLPFATRSLLFHLKTAAAF